MGFSGIGIWEILLILVVALLVLGPNKLPGIARTLGKTMRTIKKAGTDLTTTLTREVELTDDKPSPPPPKEESNIKTGETPSSASNTNTPAQNDQPINPKGQQQQDD
jgi:Tat protein translocase TatB subunit